MATPITVEPTAPTAPVVEPLNPETAVVPEDTGTGLPDDLLKLPALQALFTGQPPALSATIKDIEKRPEAKMIVENKEPLMQAGIGFYRSLGGDIGVVFNQLYVHPNELIEADKAGKLLELAPPFDQVSESVAKSGKKNPVLGDVKTPKAPKSAPITVPPQSATGQLPPMPAASQNKLTSARTKNLLPGAPTSGPSPGAGRLLNQILKPVL